MKTLTCIVCPNGCSIECEQKDGGWVFTGNRCKRGLDYAKAEMTQPMRTFCTTVRTAFPNAPALPVRTNRPIPKERVVEAVRSLREVCVVTHVGIGDVIVPRILSLDADVVCTSDLLREP